MQDILLNYADNMKETNEKIINEMVKIRSILDQALHSRISQFDSRMVEITNEMENERVSMIEDFGIIMERAISDIMTTSAVHLTELNFSATAMEIKFEERANFMATGELPGQLQEKTIEENVGSNEILDDTKLLVDDTSKEEESREILSLENNREANEQKDKLPSM
jgi:hypothetical protein